MPLNVKQIVTVGLGLGVATAFGYHFLTTSQDDASRQTERTMQPLGEFHVAPIVSQPPPAFHDHETGVKPLSRRMHGDVVLAPTPTLQNKTSDYQKLVDSFEESKLVRNDDLPAAINPETTLPPVQPIVQAASNSDTDELNSLQISAPSIDNFDNSEFEFSLDDQPSQPVASTPPTLELVDGTVSETNATAEIENAPAFETPSIADAPIDGSETEDDVAEIDPAQLKSIDPTNDMLVVTSPYFSPTTDPKTTAHQDSVQRPKNWQANPFLDAQSSLEINDAIVATPIQNDLSLPEDGPTEFSDAETAELQRSIISLYDPMHEAIEAQAAQREANRPAANASIAATPEVPDRATLTNDGVPFSQGRIEPIQLTLSEDAAQKAVHHIEYGKTLSRRGAAFSARQEFLAALQIISVANDNATGTNRHSLSLRKAMLIIREAADFSVASPEQQIQMDVANVVDSHRSEVISQDQAADMTPVQAMNRYFATAQNHLDIAGGRNVVSAEVFFCMGKLHTLLNRTKKVLNPFDTAQSVVYHQAALLSDAGHHRSANELGVLLARNGRLDQAKLLFERSLMANPAPQAWQNLAKTHQRLGEIDFANRAQNEFSLLASQGISTATDGIQWKAINQFNADAPVEFNLERVASKPAPPVTEKTATQDDPSKSWSERLKDMF